MDQFEYRLSFRKDRQTGTTTVYYPNPSGEDHFAVTYGDDTLIGVDIGRFGRNPITFFLALTHKTGENVPENDKKAVAR